jgi:hypothetical protein
MRERISGLEERFANLASDPSAGIGYCNADATRHVLIAAALLFHLVRSEHLAGRGGDDRIHAKGAARPRRGAYQLVRSAGGAAGTRRLHATRRSRCGAAFRQLDAGRGRRSPGAD